MFGMKNSEMGIAMVQAHDMADELGHAEIGPDHILLGFTTNLRGTVQPLLAAHGLTYASARGLVTAQHVASNPDSTIGSSPDGVRIDDDREALASIGIDLDKVTEAVSSAFGEDITRAWGQRRERHNDDSAEDDADQRRRGRGHRGPDNHGTRRGGPGFGGPGFDGPGFGEQRGRRPEMPQPPLPPEFSDFPNSEWFPPFGGPRGRGRRGPQSKRFGRGPRLSEATAAMFHELHAEVRDAMKQMDDRRAGWSRIRATFQPERLVLAILDSKDSATQALVSSMTDVNGLRTALHERLAATTAA